MIDRLRFKIVLIAGLAALQPTTAVANQAPVAVDDSIEIELNSINSIPAATFLANDFDPDGDPLAIVSTGSAVNGAGGINGPAQLVGFFPDEGFVGTASIEYQISDGALSSNFATITFIVVAPPTDGVTPVGDDVVVEPVDPNTGKRRVKMKYKKVTGAGSSSAASRPPGAGEGSPAAYLACGQDIVFDMTTTAVFESPIQICIDYSELECDPENVRLLHKPGGGAYRETENQTNDKVAKEVCGDVNSLSVFAVFEAIDTDGDGLVDVDELDIAVGGCPDLNNPDSDGDTLPDGAEVDAGTDPCNVDSDGDGLLDNIDPNPVVNDASGSAIEAATRILADIIGVLDLSLFTGPNDKANRGRRNSLVNRVRNAANAMGQGDLVGAAALLESALQKIDGQAPPEDWMVSDSPERIAVANDVIALLVLLSL